MNYHAEITVTEDINSLYKCFLPEIASTARAKIDLKKTKEKLTFVIDAKDSTALRAMLNGVTKLLNVYEKVDNHGR